MSPTLRQLILEDSVVSLGQHRNKKSLFAFETSMRQFLEAWNDSQEHLPMVRHTIPEQYRAEFEALVREYENAGKDLSLYLRGRRLEMKKSGH